MDKGAQEEQPLAPGGRCAPCPLTSSPLWAGLRVGDGLVPESPRPARCVGWHGADARYQQLQVLLFPLAQQKLSAFSQPPGWCRRRKRPACFVAIVPTHPWFSRVPIQPRNHAVLQDRPPVTLAQKSSSRCRRLRAASNAFPFSRHCGASPLLGGRLVQQSPGDGAAAGVQAQPRWKPSWEVWRPR